MTEEKPAISDILFELLELVFVVGTIIFLAILFISFRPVVEERSLARLSTEIADNIMASQLTVYNAAFDPAQLQQMQNAFGNGNIEPFVRHCSVGYQVRVEDKTSDSVWQFGYAPSTATRIGEGLSFTQSYPAAIHVPGATETVKPAVLTLTLHNTWLTKTGCLVEKAFVTKRVQEMDVGCVSSRVEAKPCFFAVKTTGNHICFMASLRMDTALECRYLPSMAVDDASILYSKAIHVKAVPARASEAVDCSNPPQLQPTDAVQRVVLCAEELP